MYIVKSQIQSILYSTSLLRGSRPVAAIRLARPGFELLCIGVVSPCHAVSDCHGDVSPCDVSCTEPQIVLVSVSTVKIESQSSEIPIKF